MGYSGYPVTIRSQGLLITRTYLNPDQTGRDAKCIEVVQIDPNPTKPDITDKSPDSYTVRVKVDIPSQASEIYSARDMRTKTDKYREWCEALYEGIEVKTG